MSPRGRQTGMEQFGCRMRDSYDGYDRSETEYGSATQKKRRTSETEVLYFASVRPNRQPTRMPN